MMEGAVPNRQRTLAEIIRAPGPGTKDAEVKEEEEIMEAVEITQPAAAPYFDTQMIGYGRSGWGAM